jgi:PAS domain S-box-containing protein
VIRKTVPGDGRFWGLVSVVLDPETLLEAAGAAPVKRGFICGVRTASEEAPFFGNGDSFSEGAITTSVSVFDDSWEIALVPSNGFEEAVTSEYRVFALLTLLAIMLITALVYTLTSQQSALQFILKRRTEHLHRELEEHRRTEDRLEAERRLLRAISDTSPIGILLLDEAGVFTFSNPAARELLRVSASELHGRMFDSPDWQLADLEGNPIPSEELPFSRALRSGETVRDFRIVIYAQEEYRVVSVNAALLPDSKAPCTGDTPSEPEANAITGVVATVEDVSDLVAYENRLRSALHEREALLREVHHRVKNNLNIITSLLRLEQNRIETAAGAIAAFGDLGNRVYALAHLHQLLSHSEGVETIDLARFVREATERLRNLYDPHGHVAVDLYLADVSLHMDQAVPAGLLFTELFTIALDAASAAAAEPRRLRVTLEHDPTGSVCLEVLDETGTESFNALASGSENLRPDIVQALVDQLVGTLEMEAGSGAYARVTFAAGIAQAE